MGPISPFYSYSFEVCLVALLARLIFGEVALLCFCSLLFEVCICLLFAVLFSLISVNDLLLR